MLMQSKFLVASVYLVDDFCSYRACVLTLAVLFGAAVGWFAWPEWVGIAPLVLIAIPVWNRGHWLAPFLSMLGYHLATTWGLIRGTAVFFPDAGLALGIAFWGLSSLTFALPYLLYRPLVGGFSRGTPHVWKDGLAAVLMTVLLSALSTVLPPLGLIGWTSPWIGALPGGWVEVVLVLAAIALSTVTGELPTIFLLLTLVALILPPLSLHRTLPQGWVGINTNLGHLRSNLSYVDASMEMAPKVLADLRSGGNVVLLPETVAGPWLPGTRAIWGPVIRWTARHPEQIVLLGADVPLAGCEPHGRDLRPAKGYLDALVKIQDGHQTILPDHIPVPFSMWHPWHPRDSFRMAPFSRKPETTEIDGKKVGYLICYEQLLMWPALDLHPHGIQILLAPANDWWARGTDIPAIQRASAKAWGAFFGVPVLFAVNQ